jgi:hypothetical protein
MTFIGMTRRNNETLKGIGRTAGKEGSGAMGLY